VDGAKAGSTTVREGDQLHARFTVANSSTVALNVSPQLFFSKDAVLDASDIPSTSTATSNVKAATSILWTGTWRVPKLTHGKWHVIAKITAGLHTADGTPTDWIPLRGTVTAATS
jgi:hypothetical protein